MTPITDIKKKLNKIYTVQNRCLALKSLIIFSNLALSVIVFLNYINPTLLIKESIAFYIVLSTSVFVLFSVISAIIYANTSVKNYSSIAEEVEKKIPDFKDALNTIANIIDQNKPNLTPIEEALALQTFGKFSSSYYKGLLLPEKYSRNIFLILCVFFALLFSLFFNNSLVVSAYYGYQDMMNSTNTYFEVFPGDSKVKAGATLKLTVKLTRERNIGNPIYVFLSDDKQEKLLMRHLGNNFYEINIYDIQKPFSYYFSSERATSKTYHIATYELPEIKTKELILEPPLYTGLPTQTLNEFEYVIAPENSRFQIKIIPNKEVETFFKSKEKLEPFFRNKEEHIYSARAKEYLEYSLLLKDSEKRETETNPVWVIETIPDLPPTADIKEPVGDQKMYGIENLDIAFILTDDYGISKAQLVFQTPHDGLLELELNIYQAKKEKNVILENKVSIDLINIYLQNGDLISYYIKVWDNKEPTPQISTSNIKFINIIPGKIQKKDEPEEESKMQGQTARLNDIIAELKRIYRATIPLQYEKRQEILMNQSVEYANALGDLKNNTSQRFKKLNFISEQTLPNELLDAEDTQYKGLGEEEKLIKPSEFIQTIAKNILKDLENAEFAMRSPAIVPALQSETSALQKLNQLSQLLEQLMKPSESESDQSSDQEQDTEKQQAKKKENKNKQQSLEEKKKQIQQLLDKLESAQDRNTVTNQQLNKTGENLNEDEKKYFSERKKDLKAEMQSASDEMQTDQDFFPIQDQIIKAIRETTNEEYNLAKGQKQTVLKHSTKTDFFLQQAISQLKNMKNKLEQSAIQNAQNAIDDLIKKQNDLKNRTQNEKDKNKQTELAKEQEQLKEQLKDLVNKIKNAIQETEANALSASNELENSLNQLNANNIEQQMGKASKSIFYGMNDKAQKEQSSILKSLQDVKNSIQSAQEKVGDPNKQQLLKALSKLNQLKDSPKESKEGGKAQQLKETLEELGGQNAPQFLKDTEKLAEQLMSAKSEQTMGITAEQLIIEAMTLIENKLKEMEISDQIRKKMHQQLPPDAYRKMVEEYFKNLSRKKQ